MLPEPDRVGRKALLIVLPAEAAASPENGRRPTKLEPHRRSPLAASEPGLERGELVPKCDPSPGFAGSDDEAVETGTISPVHRLAALASLRTPGVLEVRVAKDPLGNAPLDTAVLGWRHGWLGEFPGDLVPLKHVQE